MTQPLGGSTWSTSGTAPERLRTPTLPRTRSLAEAALAESQQNVFRTHDYLNTFFLFPGSATSGRLRVLGKVSHRLAVIIIRACGVGGGGLRTPL